MEEEHHANNTDPAAGAIHRFSLSYNLFILVLTVFSIIVVAGLLNPSVNLLSDEVLWRIDFLICMIFLVDFFYALWRSPKRSDYFFKRGGWLDLLGSIPTVPGLPWTSLLRFARLSRGLLIYKSFQGKNRQDLIEETRRQPEKTALLSIIIAAVVLITTTSLLVLVFERGAPDASIRTGSDAFWWAMVTITTVGYGDFVPVTYAGRILGIILMTFGIGIFAVLTSFVAARVVRLQGTGLTQQEEIAAMRSELAEIRQLLKDSRSQDSADRGQLQGTEEQ
jgi:voltage-gated potassium channel